VAGDLGFVLHGEQGNDLLLIGAGSDRVDGGSGLDTGFTEPHHTLSLDGAPHRAATSPCRSRFASTPENTSASAESLPDDSKHRTKGD
jgi:Ca2+-binding RTX toxin-like protein